MNRFFFAAIFLTAVIGCTRVQKDEEALKPRIVVLTDIGPAEVEPDDNESAVRLMAYADRFEIEALITTIGWNCDPYPPEWAEYLHRVVDAYEQDVPNLMKRSAQDGFLPLEQEQGSQELGYWPSAGYLRSRTVYGSPKAGIGVIGEDNDTPGSELIIRLADEEDDRPIWVCVWGGANTFAQAVWRVQHERSAEELSAFLRKFRLYTITDQDMVYAMRADRAYSSHQWLRNDFYDQLMLVWDESAWLNQNALGRADWNSYATHIQGHGALGNVYPHFLWGVEGDTPSFLHVMPNGLNNPDDPTQVGWGGMHFLGRSPDFRTKAWTNWRQPEKDMSDRYEKRFYQDEFNDFAARMQWAAEGKGNRNPEVVIGRQGGLEPVEMTAKPGQTVTLDASRSKDPDGDKLSFHWWFQEFPGAGAFPALKDSTSARIRFQIPEDSAPCQLHLICEVHDDGAFTLPSYRRVIITVSPSRYLPKMGAYTIMETTCPEVSGLCLAPDGNGLLAASDENGVYHINWDGKTSEFYTEERMDCEGVTIDPATKDVYYIVERKQEVHRLAAPGYKTSELLGVISDVGLGTNDGLEAVTFYKDGTLLVGNQWKPIRLMRYSVNGEVTGYHDLTGTTEIADLYYDPVRDVLWIADSEQRTLNMCTIDGDVLASWNVPFIDNPESICVDHEHSCIWMGDDTTSKIYKISFENL
ncbi:MAG: DUF1593 domain-containing protein [Bacteroidales bacterium]|nr:DUF1593 domain-containing protein [Bacteroidales bacterium]